MGFEILTEAVDAEFPPTKSIESRPSSYSNRSTPSFCLSPITWHHLELNLGHQHRYTYLSHSLELSRPAYCAPVRDSFMASRQPLHMRKLRAHEKVGEPGHHLPDAQTFAVSNLRPSTRCPRGLHCDDGMMIFFSSSIALEIATRKMPRPAAEQETHCVPSAPVRSGRGDSTLWAGRLSRTQGPGEALHAAVMAITETP